MFYGTKISVNPFLEFSALRFLKMAVVNTNVTIYEKLHHIEQ